MYKERKEGVLKSNLRFFYLDWHLNYFLSISILDLDPQNSQMTKFSCSAGIPRRRTRSMNNTCPPTASRVINAALPRSD